MEKGSKSVAYCFNIGPLSGEPAERIKIGQSEWSNTCLDRGGEGEHDKNGHFLKIWGSCSVSSRR